MIIADKNSTTKFFHYESCPYALQISQENKILFKNKDEARQAGYKHCKECSRLLKYYNENKNNIDHYLSENNFKMYIDDDSMYLYHWTSAWKITIVPDGVKLILFHANTSYYSLLKHHNGHLIHTYHKQSYKGRLDILSMLKYIVDHDIWKDNKLKEYKYLPRNTKKQRKAYRHAKNISHKVKMRNRYNLLELIDLEMKNKDRH